MHITACTADFGIDDAADTQHTASCLTLSLWEWQSCIVLNTLVNLTCS